MTQTATVAPVDIETARYEAFQDFIGDIEAYTADRTKRLEATLAHLYGGANPEPTVPPAAIDAVRRLLGAAYGAADELRPDLTTGADAAVTEHVQAAAGALQMFIGQFMYDLDARRG